MPAPGIEPAPESTDTLSDADLVLRSRSGDKAAFSELWSRHYRSGVAAARAVSPGVDADDLVQEAYTRIYHAILRGGGPVGAFRSYLFASIRNTAVSWERASHDIAVDDLDDLEDPASADAVVADALDRGLTHRAFRSLPARWQEILWYTEIEEMAPKEVALLLGMTPNATAQLAVRAREGLRAAWIQAHLTSADAASECGHVIERLGAYARNRLGPRSANRIDAHLAGCSRCAVVASEAKDVGSRLGLVLLPLALGVTASSTYLAGLHASTSVVALAAGASPVVGAAPVIAAPLAAHATPLTAAAQPVGIGTAATAASGHAASAVVGAVPAATTIGVTSTAGFSGLGLTAALVVGGIVTAATVVAVLPAVFDGSEPVVSADAAGHTTGGEIADPEPVSPTDIPPETPVSVPVASPSPSPAPLPGPRTVPPSSRPPLTFPMESVTAPVETDSATPAASPAEAPGFDSQPTPAPSLPPDAPQAPIDGPAPDPLTPHEDEPIQLAAPVIVTTTATLVSDNAHAPGGLVTFRIIVSGTPDARVDLSIGSISLASAIVDADGSGVLDFSVSVRDLLMGIAGRLGLTLDAQTGPTTPVDLRGVAISHIDDLVPTPSDNDTDAESDPGSDADAPPAGGIDTRAPEEDTDTDAADDSSNPPTHEVEPHLGGDESGDDEHESGADDDHAHVVTPW